MFAVLSAYLDPRSVISLVWVSFLLEPHSPLVSRLKRVMCDRGSNSRRLVKSELSTSMTGIRLLSGRTLGINDGLPDGLLMGF